MVSGIGSNKVTQKAKARTKSSHIWDEGKGYTIIHEATGVRYYYCCYYVDQKKDPKYKPLSNVDQEASKGGEQEGQGNKGDESDKDDEDNKSQEEDKGNKEDTVKYIIVDN